MKSLIPWQKGHKTAAPVCSDGWFGRREDPFDNFFPAPLGAFANRLPSVDVTEDKKEVKVRAEIPGLNEKDIELTWHDGVLTMRGEKKNEKEEKSKDYYYRECSYGSFSRDIEIGRNVNWEKAIATYKNGVLSVSLPKTYASQKAIEVKIE
jgi:HSP20 family protein